MTPDTSVMVKVIWQQARYSGEAWMNKIDVICGLEGETIETCTIGLLLSADNDQLIIAQSVTFREDTEHMVRNIQVIPAGCVKRLEHLTVKPVDEDE